MERKQMVSKERRHFKPQKGPKNNEKYKKFIGSKSEGQGFADKRKRKIKYEYMKMLKKEKQKEGRLQQTSTSTGAKKPESGTDTGARHPGKARKIGLNAGSTSTQSSMLDIGPKGLAGSHVEELGTRNKVSFHSQSSEQRTRNDPESTKQSAGRPKDKQFRKDGHIQQKGVNRFSKAAEEHRQKKEKKILKNQEVLERKKQHGEAMLSYQKRKQETFKKICKKTHKGQPVMKNQIEYLLQKIEKQVNHR